MRPDGGDSKLTLQFNSDQLLLHELRWGGVYAMLQRYEDFRPYLNLLENDAESDRELSDNVDQDDVRRIPLFDLLPSASEQLIVNDFL
ncbi:hypothetical protein LEN26_008682 [Aphanomyces euteiches]|nr:hypothetical protein LEN26_008682 [Aphanomyces euteiches]KAH9181378.1 hypothetical protein AeNC1_016646 [Aphanomyces euteiches]